MTNDWITATGLLRRPTNIGLLAKKENPPHVGRRQLSLRGARNERRGNPSRLSMIVLYCGDWIASLRLAMTGYPSLRGGARATTKQSRTIVNNHDGLTRRPRGLLAMTVEFYEKIFTVYNLFFNLVIRAVFICVGFFCGRLFH